MISQTAEYALRAVVFLAMNQNSSFTSQQVSITTKVPAAYLSKVLQSLAKSGLIHSQRGMRGGFCLRRDPTKITILEVLNAVDPIQRIRECPLGIEAHGTTLCALHQKLDEALGKIENTFAEVTIKDLLYGAPSSLPLCDFSPVVHVSTDKQVRDESEV